MKVSVDKGEFVHQEVYRNLMYTGGDKYAFQGENGFDDAVGACVTSSRTDAPSFTPSTEVQSQSDSEPESDDPSNSESESEPTDPIVGTESSTESTEEVNENSVPEVESDTESNPD